MAPPASTTRELGDSFTPVPTAQAVSPPPPIQTTLPPLSPFSTDMSGFGAASPSSPALSSQPASRGTESGFSPYHGSAAAVAANIFRPSSSIGQSGADHDAQSIRSGRSLSSSASQGVSKHPELHGPGLNTSIIETVSAWFEHGLCTKSIVLGEIALAYNAPNYTSPFGSETIRLDGFEKLEKVAPNPAFIADATTAKGEYTVNLSHVQKTAVAFKYQLAPTSGASAGEHAPLLLTTSWKIDAGVAMCIVSYSLNPAFILPAGVTEVVLNGLTLILHLGSDGAKAQSCQSKPVGTFDRTRGLIYWTLGDAITLSASPQKLLAKFSTSEGEAKPGNVEAKWDMLSANGGSGLAVLVKDEAGQEADPFADADERSSSECAWRPAVGGQRRLCAGTYTAA